MSIHKKLPVTPNETLRRSTVSNASLKSKSKFLDVLKKTEQEASHLIDILLNQTCSRFFLLGLRQTDVSQQLLQKESACT